MKNMDKIKKLYLDDVRYVSDSFIYMHSKIGSLAKIYLEENWSIVRNYEEFTNFIISNGLPDIISFDHDLAIGYYHKNLQEDIINYNSLDFNEDLNKTGYHCAKFLCDYCSENKLKLCDCFIHSYNPVGAANILHYLENFKKHQ